MKAASVETQSCDEIYVFTLRQPNVLLYVNIAQHQYLDCKLTKSNYKAKQNFVTEKKEEYKKKRKKEQKNRKTGKQKQKKAKKTNK